MDLNEPGGAAPDARGDAGAIPGGPASADSAPGPDFGAANGVGGAGESGQLGGLDGLGRSASEAEPQDAVPQVPTRTASQAENPAAEFPTEFPTHFPTEFPAANFPTLEPPTEPPTPEPSTSGPAGSAFPGASSSASMPMPAPMPAPSASSGVPAFGSSFSGAPPAASDAPSAQIPPAALPPTPDQAPPPYGQAPSYGQALPAPPTAVPNPAGIPGPAGPNGGGPADQAFDPARPKISLRRAFSEISLVYAASFGLGIVSAIGLLTDPSLDGNQVISGGVDAMATIFQYVMQGAIVLFGVGYYAQRRGWTLGEIFGHFIPQRPYQATAQPAWPTPAVAPQAPPQQAMPQAPPNAYGYPQQGYNPYPPPPQQQPQQQAWPNYAAQPYPYGQAQPQPFAYGQPQQPQPQPQSQPTGQIPVQGQVPPWAGVAPQANPYQPGAYQPSPYQPSPYQPSAYPGYAAFPAQAYYAAPVEPRVRSTGWQFSRAFFVSMAGVLAFLITVIIYTSLSGDQTGAPSMGHSLWLVPVGLVTALAAGFGEEVLVTGMVVTTLEQAGLRNKAWIIYLVAIALRIPYHLYYGWASLGVITFTVVNIWVYRRWRVLWPIVIAHAVYDGVQFLGELSPGLAGLLLILLFVSTFVMLFVILGIEARDSSARRRFDQWKVAAGLSA